MPETTSSSRLKPTIQRWLPFAREITEPTYEEDRIGDVKQWDEREILFTRADLFHYFGPDSPQFREYYTGHPEHLAYDQRVAGMAGLGRTGGIDTPMFEAQFDLARRLGAERFVTGEPAPERVSIPARRAAEKVKRFARLLGADLVKIGPLHQEWVYSHVGRSFGNQEGFAHWGTPIDLSHHPNAIGMGFRMDYDLMKTAPDFPVLLATAQGYVTGTWVSIQLASYIRMLGYSARAHHLYNYRVLVVPVAVDCGLGELSRAGYLITKELGLGLRLAVVTTDMPLAHDRPVDVSAQSFCDSCKICADECPIGAIPRGDKVAYNGIVKWKLDEEKCYRYWHAAGTDCGICMTVCPWTKPNNWFHRTIAHLATMKGPHQGLMATADRLLYGPHRSRPRPAFIDPLTRPAHATLKEEVVLVSDVE